MMLSDSPSYRHSFVAHTYCHRYRILYIHQLQLKLTKSRSDLLAALIKLGSLGGQLSGTVEGEEEVDVFKRCHIPKEQVGERFAD